jgi:hypothetical protein
MRLCLSLGLILLTVGCAAPHSSGAVWAQQNLDAERVMFQLGDAQRAQLAQNFELSLVDDELASERQRLDRALHACPGQSHALQPSPGDRLRDSMRIRAQNDPARLAQVANLALADWYLRRAAATSNASLCGRAKNALDGSVAVGPQPQSESGDFLQGLPVATLTRDGSHTDPVPTTQPLVTLSNYALGYVDSVQAAAPLPHYLAGVYGGSLEVTQPAADAETAANLVDAQAPAYPQWEPDALYLALRGGNMP